MKFGENLTSLSIPEWKSYNIDYNDIKSKIKQLTKKPDSDEQDDSDSTTAANSKPTRHVTLKSLQNTFIQNFNYVDLFIITKRGELERKLILNQKTFNRVTAKLQVQLQHTYAHSHVHSHLQIQQLHTTNILDHQIKLNELKYQVLEISRVLRNLNRFIIIQKIACNKIFKKFSKYYSNEDISSKFIHNLKTYLSTNPNSFINIDLTNLTLELSYFLDCITEELKRLEQLSEDNGRRRSKNSLFSDKSVSSTSPNSVTYASSTYTNTYSQNAAKRLHPQQQPATKNLKFDLDISIKKNFKIDCLIADNHNLNDILLNLHVLLNCENLNDDLIRRRNSSSSLTSVYTQRTTNNGGSSFNHSLLSYTYLTEKLVSGDRGGHTPNANSGSAPACIISQFNQPNSLLISHVGGLRKDAYCILPNDFVQLLLNHLLEPNNQEISQEFHSWFLHNEVNPLTKMAIDWVLNKRLKPTLKMLLKRSRYLIRKTDEEIFSRETALLTTGLVLDENVDGEPPASETEVVTKNFEDDFLIALDQDIVTTNNPMMVQSLEFDIRLQDFEKDSNCIGNLSNDELFDKFPYHHLSIYSNDSTLSNFKTQMNKNYLTDKVNTEPIIDNPNARYLKRVPLKIQQLLNLNSINLFNGDLSFYFYMLSCYYNKLPPHDYQNSHFISLLTLNLLKQSETSGTSNEVAKKMFEKRTRQVLKTQSSLRSIKLVSEGCYKQNEHHEPQNGGVLQTLHYNQPQTHQYYVTPQHSQQFQQQPRYDRQVVPSLPIKDEELQLLHTTHHDSYGMHMYGVNAAEEGEEDSNFGVLDRIIQFVVKFSSKWTGSLNQDLERGMNIDEFYFDEEEYDDEDGGDLSSLASSRADYHRREKYEDQYMRNYDEILSIIYFLFFFISLFISGIIIGIVYSIIKLSTEDTKFLVEDNVVLILIIMGGLLLSLLFSMVSINLNLSRYRKGPAWHTVIVWTGTCIVGSSFIWTLVLLFE